MDWELKNQGRIDSLQKILLEVRGLTGKECIIAGGAVRDTLLGVQIKDYDVYVKCSKEDLEITTKLLRLSYNKKHSGTYETGMSDILFIGEIYSKTANKYCEIIIVDTDKDLLDYVFTEFDFNICKVAFNGDFVKSPEFDECVNTKTIKLSDSIGKQKILHSVCGGHLQRMFYKFSTEFKFEGLNKNFWEYNRPTSFMKIIKRSKIADKLVKDYVIKTDKYMIVRK